MALPPGPRIPTFFQGMAWWNRPTAWLERNRARYGNRFTIRLPGQPPWAMISDPEQLKQIFTAPPDVLHPGEGARILEPIVGKNSVILLDEQPHLEQRKLLLPAFHGDKMAALRDAMEELAQREVESWPTGEPVELHTRFQNLTLEIILRSVFGIDAGSRFETLRDRMPEVLEFGPSPASLNPAMRRQFGGRGPYARMLRVQAEADDHVYAEIDERRSSGERGDDILSMLLDARHEDGSEMSREEIRDELMTALVAGHETSASALGFAFARLARPPGRASASRSLGGPPPRRPSPACTRRSTPTTATRTSPPCSTRPCASGRCCRRPSRAWSRSRSRSASGTTSPASC